jgi:hypothetical protein
MMLHDAPAPLHSHALESLCATLIAGRSVSVEGEDSPFALHSSAARSILAWYWKYRDKWTRNVQKEDVEAIVQQLCAKRLRRSQLPRFRLPMQGVSST